MSPIRGQNLCIQYIRTVLSCTKPVLYHSVSNLSYICLGYYVCVCVTICVGTLCYSFSFINQTDQGDEREGLKREGLKMERKERDRSEREGVKRLFIV